MDYEPTLPDSLPSSKGSVPGRAPEIVGRVGLAASMDSCTSPIIFRICLELWGVRQCLKLQANDAGGSVSLPEQATSLPFDLS